MNHDSGDLDATTSDDPTAGAAESQQLFKGSAGDERHPEAKAASLAGLGTKLRAEASEGEGLTDKARRVLHELDRDISGEYERREDGGAEPRAAGRNDEQSS